MTTEEGTSSQISYFLNNCIYHACIYNNIHYFVQYNVKVVSNPMSQCKIRNIVMSHLISSHLTCTCILVYVACYIHLNLNFGGRFGLSKTDDFMKLAALSECCQIRLSTFEKLLEFGVGDTPISTAMRTSLKKDLVAPILTEDYLTVRICILLGGYKTLMYLFTVIYIAHFP